MNKPNGQFMLEPNQTKILEFVRNLSIRKASGIGNISEQMLNGLGEQMLNGLVEQMLNGKGEMLDTSHFAYFGFIFP